MLYSLLRPLLFRLDAETSHHLTLASLHLGHALGLGGFFTKRVKGKPCRAMGLDFPNPVGLAAGLDKNGEYIDALAALGFGFIEVGTVTPRPQPGNPRPRLFRVPQAQAIINRMGFNNHGVDRLIENIRRTRYKGILGINIGKNADTPMENAVDDYIACLRKVYPFASYVAINISSPNSPGLRELQQKQELDRVLGVLKEEHKKLAKLFGKQAPLVLKIAPDLSPQEIEEIAAVLLAHKIDAVIATNTTVSRAGIEGLSQESGGVSGAPLNEKSTAVIRQLAAALQGELTIIGVGGIMSGADALEKLYAGAGLVQIYSGLIYRGPELVDETIAAL
ncbi:MAG TPA: quinone-dependent dihydroorotate dehydrogenase [Burkholderiales bacterium]|nr:quinone-dependent dihydroorotate dehydrogenase [Burkholderiales bacterium]